MLPDKLRVFEGATVLFIAEPFLQLLGFSGEEYVGGSWPKKAAFTPCNRSHMRDFLERGQKAAFEQGLERDRNRVTKSGLSWWALSKCIRGPFGDDRAVGMESLKVGGTPGSEMWIFPSVSPFYYKR